MTPLEQRILQARNHQLVARALRDRVLESAATKMLDVCLDHWARQVRFKDAGVDWLNASSN